MGEPRSSRASNASSIGPPPPAPPPPLSSSSTISLVEPSQKKKHKTKVVRVFRSVFRSLPIMTPVCKVPDISHNHHHFKTVNGSSGVPRVSGTLFGYPKGRVSFSIQETTKCLPSAVLELSIQTSVLQKEMAAGMVRVALECEKRSDKDKTGLLEEPVWTMYCNGKKTGYGVRRDATEMDLSVMEILKPVSMGAGVLPMMKPGGDDTNGGEMAYMRAPFEHVVGSKDSETLYMLSPEGNTAGPELTIFFVRI